MGSRKIFEGEESLAFQMRASNWVCSGNRTKNQSMVNMVNLNLRVLKDHVLKQDAFGHQYLVLIVDMALEEIIRTRKGEFFAIPMELIDIYNVADEELKSHKKSTKKGKEFTRLYVLLWSRLFNYISSTLGSLFAERIMLRAYNKLEKPKYSHQLKIV